MYERLIDLYLSILSHPFRYQISIVDAQSKRSTFVCATILPAIPLLFSITPTTVSVAAFVAKSCVMPCYSNAQICSYTSTVMKCSPALRFTTASTKSCVSLAIAAAV